MLEKTNISVISVLVSDLCFLGVSVSSLVISTQPCSLPLYVVSLKVRCLTYC